MTTIHPSEFPAPDTKRIPRPRGSEFPSELSALHPSRYEFSRKRFRRQTAINAGLGLTLGFLLTTLLVPLFPRLIAPLGAPLCSGEISMGLSQVHFTVGAFIQEPRILCTTAAGASQVFTVPTAAMTALLCSVAFFALFMIGSALTKKFSDPIYE